MPLRGFAARPLFDEDPNRAYKVPSLLFVGGTAPYYHDGSFETLEDLIDKNLDRMGRTSHLTADERAALVAFLKRL
jgi:cytochrome c peroxidase